MSEKRKGVKKTKKEKRKNLQKVLRVQENKKPL